MKDDGTLLLFKEITNMGLGVILNENRIISETKKCILSYYWTYLKFIGKFRVFGQLGLLACC